MSWMLWHPHQRLWNWGLVGAIRKIIPQSALNEPIIGMIVLIDTLLLLLHALKRRLSLLGLTTVFTKARVPDDVSVLYLDLGTHREGAELALMIDSILPKICDKFEAYGFEANEETFQQVNKKFLQKASVGLVHKALCNTIPVNGKIRLYHNGPGGLGDSVYRQSDSYEDVDAIRLSGWLRENNLALEDRICLLRMNIEGAEYDVIEDLVENGLARLVDGYYGMWDDICKIDRQRDDRFRAFISENDIRPFTFNGRDIRWRIRIMCTEYDVNTSILSGLRKLERKSRKPGE